MSSTMLRINLTVDIPSSTKTAQLHSVVNSMGTDITESFMEHCKSNDCALNTQSEIEKAIMSFTSANKNNSSLCP